MDLNKATIIGRLTRDPEMRSTPSGVNVTQLSLATNYVYTNQQSGQKVEQAEFHNVVLWRKLAEIASQYLKKGQRIYIEGRLQTRSWDKDGVKHYRTEIIADNMIMLDGGRGDNSNAGQNSGSNNYSNSNYSGQSGNSQQKNNFAEEDLPTIQADQDINVDDIPF